MQLSMQMINEDSVFETFAYCNFIYSVSQKVEIIERFKNWFSGLGSILIRAEKKADGTELQGKFKTFKDHVIAQFNIFVFLSVRSFQLYRKDDI